MYLDILPRDLSSFPINYLNEELTELVGSPFLMQIHEKVYDLKKDYDRIYASSEEFKKHSFRDFCWARTIVGSRIFGLLINGIKTDILAPFADMLNHKLPKQTSWNYIDEREGFVIESLEDIPLGVEVFDSYEGMTKILKISNNLCENNFYESLGFLRFKVISELNHLAVLEVRNMSYRKYPTSR